MSIAIVVKEPVDVLNYASGQEYYLHILSKVLPRYNIKVDVLTVDQLLSRVKSYNNYSSYHLYYLSFRDAVALRSVLGDSRLIYHVYHIEDATWTRAHLISWKMYLLSLQLLIDGYLATARSVCSWLRFRAPLTDCWLVEPYYECSCDSFHKLKEIVVKKFSSDEIKLLYIGRLNPFRSWPTLLLKIARGVSRRIGKPVKLTIVSKLSSNRRLLAFRDNNIIIKFINKRIDDNEKCKLYRESHFFMYITRGNVAMNPPITLLESVYHGAIPIVSSWTLSDIDVPSEIVADNVDMAINKIVDLWSDPKRLIKVINRLQGSFERFYDVFRFLKAIRSTL